LTEFKKALTFMEIRIKS